MTTSLALIDDLGLLHADLGLDDTKTKRIFWDPACTDIESVRNLAGQVDKIYTTSQQADEVSRLLAKPVYRSHPKQAAAYIVRPLPADRPVAFFASNDTIARMLKPLAALIHAPSVFILPRTKNEGAFDALYDENTSILKNQPGLTASLFPSVLVLGNDWGDEEKDLIRSCRRLNIPSICIQEGCLDWEGEQKRMRWADYAFVQGAVTLDYLSRDGYFLTGNPRFDNISPLPLPKKPLVMINSNFTYGIHEDKRDEWVGDVVHACEKNKFKYFISQHPRDHGVMPFQPVRRSNAGLVHGQIEESSILVSRFSTVIYEALLMGRQAVYYNPHHEAMQTFNDDATGGIHKAPTREELVKVFANLRQPAPVQKEQQHRFSSLHCGSQDHLAAQRCAYSIEKVLEYSGALSYTPVVKRSYFEMEEKVHELYLQSRSVARGLLKRGVRA